MNVQRRWRSRYRRILGQETSYLLRAWMLDGRAPAQDYADAQVIDTVVEGVLDGTGTVVEVDGTLSVGADGKLAFTAQATPTWGHLGHHWQAIARELGWGLLGVANVDAVNTESRYSWQDAASLASVNRMYTVVLYDNGWVYIQAGGTTENIASVQYSASTDYQLAIILGGYDANGVPWRQGELVASYLYGASFFIKGGAFTDWTLLWRTALMNTATLYAAFSNYNAAGTLSRFRVPDRSLKAVLQPQALSTFTAANGTSLDAVAPEVGGVWTEQSGDFDIQGNRASPTSGSNAIATISISESDVLARCVVRTLFDSAAGHGVVVRYSAGPDFWVALILGDANAFGLYEVDDGAFTERASAAVVIAANTDYDVFVVADGQVIDAFLDGGNKISYESASLNETATVHGIRSSFSAGTHDAEFDNFHINARASPTYDAVLGAV